MSSSSARGFTRFLTLADVAEIMNVELDEVRALVDSNQLVAVRVGRDGDFRVEQRELEEFIEDLYAARRREVNFMQHEFSDIPELTQPLLPSSELR